MLCLQFLVFVSHDLLLAECLKRACILQAVDAVKLPADHKVMDIFILLILHSTNRRKPVESMFRNKIRSAAFTEVLLQGAFGAHAEV